LDKEENLVFFFSAVVALQKTLFSLVSVGFYLFISVLLFILRFPSFSLMDSIYWFDNQTSVSDPHSFNPDPA
jgi:hypothetical protein